MATVNVMITSSRNLARMIKRQPLNKRPSAKVRFQVITNLSWPTIRAEIDNSLAHLIVFEGLTGFVESVRRCKKRTDHLMNKQL